MLNFEDDVCSSLGLTNNCDERLTIQSLHVRNWDARVGWLLARLPEDCPNSPIELYNKMRASFERLPNVYINPLMQG